MIKDLLEPFGLKCIESDSRMDFRKCMEGSSLVYRILSGSKERVLNDFSGLRSYPDY